MWKVALLVVSFCLALFSCASSGESPASGARIEKLEVDGIENVYRLSPELVTGGMPDGEVEWFRVRAHKNEDFDPAIQPGHVQTSADELRPDPRFRAELELRAAVSP